MAVTYQDPEQADMMTWRLRWTTDRTPPLVFRLFREGKLLASIPSSVQTGSFEVQVSPGEFPFLEVLDHPDAVPQIAFPGRLTLNWESVAGAASYRIEKYVAASWVAQATLSDDGSGAMTWASAWLADVTVHQFRVLAIGSDGNETVTPLTFSCEMVRHPNVPDLHDYTYNPTFGSLSITVN